MSGIINQVLFSSGPLLAGQTVTWQPPSANADGTGSLFLYAKAAFATDGVDDFNAACSVAITQNGQALGTIPVAPGGVGATIISVLSANGLVSFQNTGAVNVQTITVQNSIDRTQ